MLVFSILGYDGLIFQPSLSRHNHLENMKQAYMFSPFCRRLSVVNDRSLW